MLPGSNDTIGLCHACLTSCTPVQVFHNEVLCKNCIIKRSKK